MTAPTPSQDALDRVALVTGATGGIGRSLVADLAARGWKVLATDLAAEAAFDAGDDRVRYVGGVDVTDPEQVVAAVAAAEELGPFTACVANAGITPEDFAAFADADPRHWRSTLDVNVLGTLYTFQAATRALLARGAGGRLAATTSVAGVRAEPQLAAYSASKVAIVSIVKSLALELGAHGITVNAVAPGPVAGPHQDRVIEERKRHGRSASDETASERFERHRNEGRPIVRLAENEDVNAAFAWLLSDEAAYITGNVIVVDGGGVLV